MAEFPDAPDVTQIVESKEEDRFGRWIAIAIVLVTLAAALTAWLQAGAGRDDDEAAVRAERLASQTLGTIARAKALAELRVQRERLAAERGRRAESLARLRAFGVADDREARALERGWRRAERATRRATERIAQAEAIPPLRGFGPRRDPSFPSAYLSAAAREGERLSAIRDAANREGDRAEEQVGAYGVALTMFAVSVFLFGYALTPYGRRNRRLFAGAAAVMAVVAAAWALVNVLDGPERSPEEAAEAFADATVAAAAGDREGAIEALDRALELRPEYPAAYTARGLAYGGAVGRASMELPDPPGAEDLRRARDDLDRAVELDSEDIDAWLGLGAAELLLGIETGDSAALDRAALAAAEAIERDPVQPGARLLAAEAAYARGDPGAPELLTEATRRIAVVDDGDRPRDEAARRELIAGALFVFERLQRAGLLEPGAAATAKAAAIAGAWPDVGPPLGTEPGGDGAGPGASEPFKGLNLDVGPAGYEVGWDAPSRGRAEPAPPGARPFDAERDELSIALYAEDEGSGWVAISELSGPVRAGELAFDPSSDRAFVRRERLEVTVPARCLPAGSYRAEVYVNGELVGEPEVENTGESDGAVLLDDLALLACRPPGWERLGSGGVVDGIVSPEGDAGLLAVRVPQPAAPGRGRRGTLQALEGGFGQLAPLLGSPVESRERTRGPFLDATTAPTLVVKTRDGGAIVAAARLAQGGIVVGAVYGPRSLFRLDPDSGASDAISLFQTFSDRF